MHSKSIYPCARLGTSLASAMCSVHRYAELCYSCDAHVRADAKPDASDFSPETVHQCYDGGDQFMNGWILQQIFLVGAAFGVIEIRKRFEKLRKAESYFGISSRVSPDFFGFEDFAIFALMIDASRISGIGRKGKSAKVHNVRSPSLASIPTHRLH